jgi:parallel beta-helix repeat protein
MKRQILISPLILLCIASLAAAKTEANDLPYKAGELIVRFDEPAETQAGLKQKGTQQAALAAQRAAERQAILNKAGGGSVVKMLSKRVSGLGLVKLPPGLSIRDAMAAYNKTPGIIYAEPNYKRRLCLPAIPDDLRFNEQWNLNNTGQTGGTVDADIDAPEAWGLDPDWEYVVGAKYYITVAVLDTGIDYDHPELGNNRWINIPEDLGEDDVDDDGNGYVDDKYGYDFAGDSADDPLDADEDPKDAYYHGTHVAGIIAADGNNHSGITGVCWRAKVMAVKIFADDGIVNPVTFVSDEVAGIEYAIRNGAKVINASFGGGGYSVAERDAIADAGAAGIIFVAAAGNYSSDNDSSAFYPASYNLDNIISVMATDQYDHMAYYSNYGATSVDIAAPGGDTRFKNREGILSILPTVSTEFMDAAGIPTSFGWLQGTSMAAPHVSGAVALMMSTRMWDHIPINLGDIKKMLLRGADRLPDLKGRCVSGGRLNLYNALDMTIGAGEVLNANTAVRYPTIQQAIGPASNGHTLIANKNHWYLENINFGGKQITLRSGDIDAPFDPCTSPQNTYITGLLNTGYAVRLDNSEPANTILKGFTVSDGHAGGIHILGSSPTITDCIISGNTGSGGLYCYNAPSPAITNCTISDNTGSYAVFCYNSSPTITGSTISDNTTSHEGGGIHCDNSSSPIITGCTIADNTTNMDGGGIYCDDGSDANITNTTISGNTAGYGGGGVYCTNSSPTIGAGTVITGNTAEYEGGGIHCDGTGANPTITDCNITGNTANSEGGGIFCYNGAEPNILNTTLSGNAAEYWGGGIGCYGASPRINNCLLVDNSAQVYDGGGISLYDASPAITNCTIADNSANPNGGLGGGIMCDFFSTPVVTDCIFSNNENYAIATDDGGSEPNLTYCMFHDNPDGDYAVYDAVSYAVITVYTGAAAINGLPNAGDNIEGTPDFVPGRLGNYYLSHIAAGQFIDSNAIDAGSDTAAGLGMDIYSTRTDNVNDTGTVDIGYHYNDPQPVVDYNLTIFVVPTGSAISPVPGTTPHKQYAHILLESIPAADYQFKVWKDDGTEVSTEPNYIVILSSDKHITAEFETIMVRLITGVDPDGETGMITPVTRRPVYYPRGKVVDLLATPDNPSHVIIWRGTDDDDSVLRSNTVTMSPPFETDPYGKELKRVEVEFYAVKILYFGNDGSYSTLQAAIDAAHDRDIIQVAPANEPYISSWGYEISGKAVTITSANPDDPCCVAATVFEKDVGEEGSGKNAFRFSNVGRNTILNGITIRRYGGRGVDGHAGMPDKNHYDGWPGGAVVGAISCSNASPTIKNCVIADCNLIGGNGGNGANGDTEHPHGGNGGWPGFAYGGALYCSWGSNPTVINTTFRNNAVIGGSGGDGGNGQTTEPYGRGGRGGGWYYPDPVPSPWEDPDVSGSYDDPGLYTGRGGAVYIGQSCSITLTGCTFIGNRSEGGTNGICGQEGRLPNLRDEPSIHWKIENFGGAAYCAADSRVKFEKCSFIENKADPNRPMIDPNDPDSYSNKSTLISYGGGVAYEDGAELIFDDCTFSDNNACVGGAIQGDWAQMLQIDRSSFISNSAYHGAGILFVGGTAKIARSNFSTNNANGLKAEGGAISCLGANTMITDCEISNNNAFGSGGGIYISSKDVFGDDIDDGNTVLVKNCLITGNSAKNYGGGISANWYSDPAVINCTIAHNTVSDGNGGGLSCSYGNYTRIINSILWGNSAGAGSQIAVGTSYAYDPRPSTVDISYSDVQGGAALIKVDTGSPYTQGDDSILNWDYATNLPRGGAGNPNPQFVSGYYLSQPAAGQTLLSPCVDAGGTDAHSADMYRHTTRTDGLLDAATVDMGYHYLLDTGLVGDFNYDFVVNFADLPRFLMHWLDEGCVFPDWCHEKDLNQDGVVNFIDQSIFAENYGETETLPPVPNPMTLRLL